MQNLCIEFIIFCFQLTLTKPFPINVSYHYIYVSFRRSRGRPKKNVNYATLAGFTNLNRPGNLNRPANLNRPSNVPIKRKQVEEEPDEIQILSTNGLENESSQIKKSKVVDDQAKRLMDDQPKRSLPHRAARFTESYGGSPDVVVVSDEENDEESESESDSDCSPIPSPICNVKTKEELELWESNVQRLKKQLNDEEMKLVLLLKLKESQKSKEPKTEASGSPLPSSTLPSNVTNFNSQKNYPVLSRNNVQQSIPNKQLLPSKFLPVKKVLYSDKKSYFILDSENYIKFCC